MYGACLRLLCGCSLSLSLSLGLLLLLLRLLLRGAASHPPAPLRLLLRQPPPLRSHGLPISLG